MPAVSPPTIDQALNAFLAEQRERLAARTFQRYAEVIDLLRYSLDADAHTALDDRERQAWERAFAAGDERAFCRLFGPEKIPEHLGEFLGCFMVRKVVVGKEMLKASGTVSAKLAAWLQTYGYIDQAMAAGAAECVRDASRDLPVAERLGDLLQDVAADTPDLDTDAVDEQDWIEDQLAITNVEPGLIWFERGVGPIEIPREASDLARPGWMVTLTAARTDDGWQLLEVSYVDT